jgi:nicotinate-nucleotide pyrophosphorylase (carboxylating)
VLSERDLRSRIAADARRVAEQAILEDGHEDVTTAICVGPHLEGTGILEYRSGGMLAGLPYADAVAEVCALQPVTWYHAAGSAIAAGTTIGVLQGNLAQILRAERPLLNLLQRACGIATETQTLVSAVRGTGARILHTRKTAPGLRLLDVGAVLAGEGFVHRLDLATTVMVKDNHWRALRQSGKSLSTALEEARALGVSECYVEVESEAQVAQACDAGAGRLLIDNQTPDTVRAWALEARRRRPGIRIEATGGITLANVRAYADAGADYISVGSLTHSVKAADISLEVTSD